MGGAVFVDEIGTFASLLMTIATAPVAYAFLPALTSLGFPDHEIWRVLSTTSDVENGSPSQVVGGVTRGNDS